MMEVYYMYKAYKFRMYPNSYQKQLLNKTFGCVRFIYNYFLDKCIKNGFIKAFDMCGEIKNLYNDYPFLKEVDSCSLRCTVFNLEDAFKNYYSKHSNYPRFKSKFNKQSYRTTCIKSTYKNREYSNIELDLVNRKIKLPKIGLVDIRGYRNFKKISGSIINATIEKETTNKYYVSVVVEEKEFVPSSNVIPQNIVGIDLGIKDLVVTSDGEKYANPKEILKREKRLKRLQKKLARQISSSNNYYKTKEKIAIIHSKIKNSRKHNIINIVNRLVKEHDIIVSEKLKIQEMTHNRNLAKNILDASFNRMCQQLKWKCSLIEKYYYQVDTYFPSSKKCSHCDNTTKETDNLNVREWICSKCGYENDRDINASINIMFEGLRMHYQRKLV